MYIKSKIDFFIFYFVISTITKQDIKTIILSCKSLPNTIISQLFFLSHYLLFLNSNKTLSYCLVQLHACMSLALVFPSY